ncbi:unnamed protein product [Ceratitis capitata]|uniref:(Mediterranean fruit fly) hypothetical protein n=1 Tax=Ceratitis capitata TaxID=7213 RepID=A0A811UL00_CERCA|nr:unnamed protein product [Ceratitis capitata]
MPECLWVIFSAHAHLRILWRSTTTGLRLSRLFAIPYATPIGLLVYTFKRAPRHVMPARSLGIVAGVYARLDEKPSVQHLQEEMLKAKFQFGQQKQQQKKKQQPIITPNPSDTEDDTETPPCKKQRLELPQPIAALTPPPEIQKHMPTQEQPHSQRVSVIMHVNSSGICSTIDENSCSSTISSASAASTTTTTSSSSCSSNTQAPLLTSDDDSSETNVWRSLKFKMNRTRCNSFSAPASVQTEKQEATNTTAP